VKQLLSEVGRQVRGVSYSKDKVSDKPRQGYLPVLRANNITEYGLDFTDLVYVNSNCIKEQQKIKKGDVIIAASSGSLSIVGKAVQISYDYEGSFGAFCKVFRPSKSVVSEYIGHFFSSKKYRHIISNLACGANINNLKNEHIDNLEIYIPPLPEQKRIAAILDKADSLRSLRRKAIEKLNSLSQAIFYEMFGNPVENERKWDIKTLKDLSTKISSGSTPKGGKQVYVDEGIIFLRSQNVWRNKIEFDDVVYIDNATHQKMQKTNLQNGDILITKTGRINTENSSLGRAAMFLGKDNSANINGHVYLIRLKKNVLNEFILYIMTTPEYRDYIRSVCVGGIDKRQINKEHLEEFPMIYPPIEEQQKFIEQFSIIEKHKKYYYEQLGLAESLFLSLQQKAFRGEL
jgi:type I restriction enzyme, S subunit